MARSLKPPNCTAKEFFVVKDCHTIRNLAKRIKQIVDAEYKKINLISFIMNFNYLKDKQKIFFYYNYFKNMMKYLMES